MYGLTWEEIDKLSFTTEKIFIQLMPDRFDPNKYPNDDAGDKALCAELHKRAEAMELFVFDSIAGQLGECVDPILSLPNL